MSRSGLLVPDARAAAEPALGAADAVSAAAASVDADQTGPSPCARCEGSARRRTSFTNGYAPRLADPRPIGAELVTFPMPAGQPARVAWKVTLEVSDSADYETRSAC